MGVFNQIIYVEIDSHLPLALCFNSWLYIPYYLSFGGVEFKQIQLRIWKCFWSPPIHFVPIRWVAHCTDSKVLYWLVKSRLTKHERWYFRNFLSKKSIFIYLLTWWFSLSTKWVYTKCVIIRIYILRNCRKYSSFLYVPTKIKIKTVTLTIEFTVAQKFFFSISTFLKKNQMQRHTLNINSPFEWFMPSVFEIH